MKKSILQVALVMLVFAAPAAPVLADEAKRDDSRNCLSTRRLKSTAVIDDKNILFVMTGDQVYHNALPRQCSGLAKAGAFTYSTLGGNVCRQDTIQVLISNSDLPGRTCTLGAFQSGRSARPARAHRGVARPGRARRGPAARGG